MRNVLFYDFAVQSYDLEFSYNSKMYYALSDPDHVAVCDEHFSEVFLTFKNGNELIKIGLLMAINS